MHGYLPDHYQWCGMGKAKKPVDKRVDGRIVPRQFRLEEEVMERLQRIADYYTETTGVKHSRADAIRLMAKERDDAINGKK